jgi:hypothetical protein
MTNKNLKTQSLQNRLDVLYEEIEKEREKIEYPTTYCKTCLHRFEGCKDRKDCKEKCKREINLKKELEDLKKESSKRGLKKQETKKEAVCE